MKKLLPFSGGAAVAVAGALVALSAAGTGDACAQAGGAVAPRIDCPGSPATPPATTGGTRTTPGAGDGSRACTATTVFRTIRVTPRGRGARVTFTRRGTAPVRVEVFQSASTRSVLGERLVFRADTRRGTVTWTGARQGRRRAPTAGVFFVRATARGGTRRDVRRFALSRTATRTRTERTFALRDGCGELRAFKLERPAFGGARNRAVSVSFRLATTSRAVVELRRGGRLVRTLSSATRRAGTLHRVRLDAERLRRGRYEVRLRYGSRTASLFATRI